MCFFKLCEEVCLEQTALHHIETLMFHEVSFQKLTQFSQGTMWYILLLLTQKVNF
jgi:hypothetical protein